MPRSVRKRIIACVDGTWFNQDGQECKSVFANESHGTFRTDVVGIVNGQGNNSNVFRVEASIQKGNVIDKEGHQIEQVGLIRKPNWGISDAHYSLADYQIFSGNRRRCQHIQ